MAGAAAASPDGRDLPIVDAHQHFWDLERHYYPWLCDPEPVPFRYGDYSALRHDYLPEDYRRDTRAWRSGYALLARHGLSFDLQTAWWHLDAAAELARDFPDTQIIINHAALPADRSAEGLCAWRRAVERVAQAPNVAIKISG